MAFVYVVFAGNSKIKCGYVVLRLLFGTFQQPQFVAAAFPTVILETPKQWRVTVASFCLLGETREEGGVVYSVMCKQLNVKWPEKRMNMPTERRGRIKWPYLGRKAV